MLELNVTLKIFFITDQVKKSPALEFIPGIIVRFAVNDPIEDEKKIKARIRAAVMENVGYVDERCRCSVDDPCYW